MTKPGRKIERIAVRLAPGEDPSVFRMEELNAEVIDKLAKKRGLDRSKWIRYACLVQMALELTVGEADEDPDAAVVDLFTRPPAPEPEPAPVVEIPDARPNRWS